MQVQSSPAVRSPRGARPSTLRSVPRGRGASARVLPGATETARAAPHGGALVVTRELIEAHTPALLSFAQRMLARPEDAEDVVQETWISALRCAAAFEGRSSVRTWLTGILRRRIYDRYHSDRRLDPLLEDLPWEPPSGPEQKDLREAASYVTQALLELRDQERTAVVLCDVDELSREEAADHMHITRGHLRVVLHRARTKLEHHLRGHGVSAEILV
jgi:RNA polymerase sigma-70 factor (ECF subfamily)